MDKAYNRLKEIFKKIKNIEQTLSILYWDSAVIMPSGGIEARSEQLAVLNGMIHEMISSSQVVDLLNDVDTNNLDDWDKANYYLMQRTYKYKNAISADLTEALVKATSKSEMIWRKAKNENNFKLLAPYLKEVLSLTREAASIRSEVLKISVYDSLVQNYQPGLLSKDIDPIFDELRDFLPNFINKVLDKQNNSNINFTLPINIQKEIGTECMKLLGFNFDKGRLDTSEHPFCGGIPQDTRITARYKEDDFISGIMAIIHETGHALYEQNLPEPWLNQPVGSALGMAVHESQSLIYENQIARRPEFLFFLSNLLKKKFNTSFDNDQLYQSINKVSPSFIRVDADEVTYPVHIILRYDLEKNLINGGLEIIDLPEAWDDGMERLLGIRPKTDTQGCLQDIHWPMGGFGYFPSYLIGAIIAAQLYNAMEQEITESKGLIRFGNFQVANNWLKQNIHQYGSRYSLQDLLLKATGNKLSLDKYKNYLKEKFLQI
jgi:carboxypeptidase Taq